ncbi:MAG: ATPase, T2SS/T4P/T4SS family, partial [Rhodospirillaceae bacterium]
MFGRRTPSSAPKPLRPVLPPQTPAGDGSADIVPLPQNAAPGTQSPAPCAPPTQQPNADALAHRCAEILLKSDGPTALRSTERGQIAKAVGLILDKLLADAGLTPDPVAYRTLVTAAIEAVIARLPAPPLPKAAKPKDPLSALTDPAAKSEDRKSDVNPTVEKAKGHIQTALMDRIDISKVGDMPRDELAHQIGDLVAEILSEEKIQLNLIEQRDLVTLLINDMLGLGPLEPLLADEAVTDIMVNGPKQVYVERKGKLTLTNVSFRDNQHVMNICTRIVSAVGRRVDESTPLVDARLADGSRVNIIVPPLAIDGPSISIRKFAKQKITLDVMERQNNLSPEAATVLRIASRSRLNVLISGGTGSGKTTLLNALSRMIDEGERIVTIEDAAELQLQQPHVVRLETRP